MRPTQLLVAVLLSLGAVVVTAGPVVAAPAAREYREYVALGDSYVAGPGIPAPSGQPAGCARSDHNYPSLVSRALRPAVFRDLSCSGATTAHMSGAQTTRRGTNPAQLAGLSADTDLVTLGIGGNDIGFGDIISSCVRYSSLRLAGAGCRDHYQQGGRDQLAARIAATAPKVAAVLSAIRQRAPKARILLVGYPTILPDRGNGCYPLVPFSAGDVAWLRKIEKALNSMLSGEAAAADAEYVDTYRRSVGHDVCQLPGTKWVEGFIPTSPAAPAHPNALGMRSSADAVLAKVRTRQP